MTDSKKLSQSNNRNRQRSNKAAVLSRKGTAGQHNNAQRVIEVGNRQLDKVLKNIDDFQYQYTMFVGGLIRSGFGDCVQLYDNYVDRVIETAMHAVNVEIENAQRHVEYFESQGYMFNEVGGRSQVVINIKRNCVCKMIDLFVAMDKLLRLYEQLEKTPQLSTPQFFKLQSHWTRMPKNLVSRLIGLSNRFKDKLKFTAKTATAKSVGGISVANMMALLQEYQSSKIPLFPEGVQMIGIDSKAEPNGHMPEPVVAKKAKTNSPIDMSKWA